MLLSELPYRHSWFCRRIHGCLSEQWYKRQLCLPVPTSPIIELSHCGLPMHAARQDPLFPSYRDLYTHLWGSCQSHEYDRQTVPTCPKTPGIQYLDLSQYGMGKIVIRGEYLRITSLIDDWYNNDKKSRRFNSFLIVGQRGHGMSESLRTKNCCLSCCIL